MKVLVTGASGFLGGALIKRLCAEGHTVVGVSRSEPKWEHIRFTWVKMDLCQKDSYEHLAGSFDVVMHTAAKAGIWGSYDDYYTANVLATEWLLEKSVSWGVKAFVYTSSPSVVFDGYKNLMNVNESVAYPQKYYCYYSQTKMLAEKLVMSKKHLFKVVALRPHLIYGPGDNHLLPRIIEKANKGKLKKIGGHKNKVDIIYIDNCVQGHMQALDSIMGLGADQLNGKAYFIADEKPVVLWDWVNQVLLALGFKPVVSSVPFYLAYVLGLFFEFVFKILGIKSEPPLTRFVVNSLATDHYFDQSAAKNDFGYLAKVSQEEAFEKTVNHLKSLL